MRAVSVVACIDCRANSSGMIDAVDTLDFSDETITFSTSKKGYFICSSLSSIGLLLEGMKESEDN